MSFNKRLKLIVSWWLIITVTATFTRGTENLNTQFFIESILYLLVFSPFIFISEFWNFLSKAPLKHQLLLSFFVGMGIFAQLNANSRATFPWVTWRMYSTVIPEVAIWEDYQATLSSGKVKLLTPANSFLPLKNSRFQSILRRCARHTYRCHNDLIEAWVFKYNRDHEEDKVIKLSIIQNRQLLNDKENIKRKALATYEF